VRMSSFENSPLQERPSNSGEHSTREDPLDIRNESADIPAPCESTARMEMEVDSCPAMSVESESRANKSGNRENFDFISMSIHPKEV
jgi:hypothetical protein